MTKRFFLFFTIGMVLLSGTIIYGMTSRAKNIQKQRVRNIEAKLPDAMPSTPTPKPSPTPSQSESSEEKTQEPAEEANTLTKGQNYYTAISTPNSRNILLIGKDPTYSNFDTMVIVSIDEENQSVRLVDLPRDMYVDYSEPILEQLKESASDFYKEKGSRKMNAAHVVGRKIGYAPAAERFPGKSDINFLTDLISEIFDIKIDDYMAIETDGFREMVDFFGGVVVDVPYAMHYEDPTQDLYIHLDPGLQVLNGTQAEGFVRFRQGYTEDGSLVSYSRTDNTFLFLKSFFKQHVTLKNLTKIGKVYEIVHKNTKTSVQSLSEAYQYTRLVKKILDESYAIEPVKVECTDAKRVDGALYEIIRTE